MRFYTITTNGPSPGITIAGSREDLAALGMALAGAVNPTNPPAHPDGSICFDNMTVCGDPWEWIAFQIDPCVDAAIECRREVNKSSCVFVALFWTAVVIVIGLAVVGVGSFFR